MFQPTYQSLFCSFCGVFSGPVGHRETLAEQAELLVKVLGVSGPTLSLATSQPDLPGWLAGWQGAESVVSFFSSFPFVFEDTEIQSGTTTKKQKLL